MGRTSHILARTRFARGVGKVEIVGAANSILDPVLDNALLFAISAHLPVPAKAVRPSRRALPCSLPVEWRAVAHGDYCH